MPSPSDREDALPGRSFPLGATLEPGGVNFSVYSKHATRLEILLFNRLDDSRPSRVVSLEARANRTYHYWHAFVPGIGAGQIYGFRADGPRDPARGLRFDDSKVLLDPYGKAVAVPSGYDRGAACRPGKNTASAMKSVVADPASYDWEGDAPLNRPFNRTIIYELHVKGFTANPNSGVPSEKRGTYAGLIEKIPYLRDLGVTAVELLPIYHFDDQDAPAGRRNYWGYSPLSYFAPHPAYSSRKGPLDPLDEFRDMVKALHRAGIEVILDVVYNHTAEGNEKGPTISFKGLANDAYYILEPDRTYYSNYTGCGNTLNANHPIVRRLIIDSLRYWVRLMHVDGFRFDLASILSRDEAGQPLQNPPILWDIESDPVLAGTKFIAEAWDAAGLYQVGTFVGDSWKEWNGRFRDDVRSFLKGDPGAARVLAGRILGSPDLYEHEGREPEQSVNFVTCHDGFTLNDLVSYNSKHNEQNGEDNRDGADDNRSWNCGVEGPTDDSEVERLRDRQVKNALTLTLMSMGTPMFLMGDEVRRTQLGNNNAYSQDNELSWFDWSFVEKHGDILRFLQRLIRLRRSSAGSKRESQLTLHELLHATSIRWHGLKLDQPGWDSDSRILSVTIGPPDGFYRMQLLLNAHWGDLEFEIPPTSGEPGDHWFRLVDTALDPPEDVRTADQPPAVVEGRTYLVRARSCVLLVAWKV